MYQRIMIVGRLGKDPEMRYMPDGTALTSFSVATDRRWTDKATGQPVQETTWFRVTARGRQAETTNQYLTKGSMVLVEGHLRPDPQTGGPKLWTGQDGTVRASFELMAENVRFLSSRGETGASSSSYSDEPQGAQGGGKPAAHEEDDIPF